MVVCERCGARRLVDCRCIHGISLGQVIRQERELEELRLARERAVFSVPCSFLEKQR